MKKTIKMGDPAPQFSLISYDQETIELDNILEQDQKVLLVFLRHLG